MSNRVLLFTILGTITPVCILAPRSVSAQAPTAATPAASRQAGRRAMHNGLDPEAAKIDVKPVSATIAAASAFARPKTLSGTARVKPFETTIWSVDAELVSIAPEDDGDLFLVLRDANGKRMTAELPDPALVKASPWYKDILAARKAGADVVASRQKTPASTPPKPLRVRVSGSGYFGKINKDEDEPAGLRNGFQLHPVTGFAVLP